MIPRFRRMMLLVLGIGLLLLPAPRSASATIPPEPDSHFEAVVDGLTGLEGPTGLDHIRRDDGTFTDVNLHFVAERRDDGRTLECRVQAPEGQPIRFTARENIPEGRGFIHETITAREPRGIGVLEHGTEVEPVMCHADILPGGLYHRTLTVADVEISIRVYAVRLDTGEPVDFDHTYCIRGVITAVPPSVAGEVREDPRCTEPAGRGGDDATHG